MAFYGDGSNLTGVGATYGAYTAFGTSGYVDLTGIASDTRKTTILVYKWSSSSSFNFYMKLGDSGGIESSGYEGTSWYQNGGSSGSYNNYTQEFRLPIGSSTHTMSGRIVIGRAHDTSHVYVCEGYFGDSGSTLMAGFGGAKQLSGTLDRVRLGFTSGNADTGAYRVIQES